MFVVPLRGLTNTFHSRRTGGALHGPIGTNYHVGGKNALRGKVDLAFLSSAETQDLDSSTNAGVSWPGNSLDEPEVTARSCSDLWNLGGCA